MAKIYNKYTKKQVSNVKWAPRGKFFYVRGRPQKYYASKGWTKSRYGSYGSSSRRSYNNRSYGRSRGYTQRYSRRRSF